MSYHPKVSSWGKVAVEFFVILFVIGIVGGILTANSLAANVYNTVVSTFQTQLTTYAPSFWQIVVIAIILGILAAIGLIKLRQDRAE